MASFVFPRPIVRASARISVRKQAEPSYAWLHRLADAHVPALVDTLLASLTDLGFVLDESALTTLLSFGTDHEGMVEHLLSDAAIHPYLMRAQEIIEQVYAQAGTLAAHQTEVRGAQMDLLDELPLGQAAKLKMVFTLDDPKAIQWMRAKGAELVTQISEETRMAIKNIVAQGVLEGRAPRLLAREIRPLIGLTDRAAQAVQRYRQALLADGVANADTFADQYAARLLRQRAELIARTELIDAAISGQQAGWDQAVDEELIDPDTTGKRWIVTPDDRLCPVCEEMDGQTVPVGEDFVTPDGERIDGPTLHPACRCAVGLIFDAVRKGGPGSGDFSHAGRPGEVGGSAPGFGHTSIGITSAQGTSRAYRTVLGADLEAFKARLTAITGVRHVTVQPNRGGYQGGREPTWVAEYDGDGEAMTLVAETAKSFNQDSVLVVRPCEGGGCSPSVDLTFTTSISTHNRTAVEKMLVGHDIGGWTWIQRGGKRTLRVIGVPAWDEALQRDPSLHLRRMQAVSHLLDAGGLRHALTSKPVRTTVIQRAGYDQVMRDPASVP